MTLEHHFEFLWVGISCPGTETEPETKLLFIETLQGTKERRPTFQHGTFNLQTASAISNLNSMHSFGPRLISVSRVHTDPQARGGLPMLEL